MTDTELHNRYVLLANSIARLTKEASELEVAISDTDYMMSLGVYNGLAEAHRNCLVALHFIGAGEVEIVA